MKYIIILGDGMSDEPLQELGNKTPMECADTPTMDMLSKVSEIGLAHTIPKGMGPGSDVANLSVLGYDPSVYYSGRSPLEALSIGVDLKDTDVALRCNLVTLSMDDGPYEEKEMIDHSSGEISTEEAAQLVEAVRTAFETEEYKFYVGTSYRHLLVWDKGQVVELAQPHDILGRRIKDYLPADKKLREMMEKSYDILMHHPINTERIKNGQNPANSLWFWGAGTRPQLTSFEEKTGKRGAMISAVDLLKGIAVGAGMMNIIVEGANGRLDTNYEGKAEAAVNALTKDGYDFVYVHVEAPDEMGHQGSLERKIKSIELLDKRLIKPILEGLQKSGEEFRMMILPDHPTPIRIRTHSSEPVPYLLYDSTRPEKHTWDYNEKDSAASGNVIEKGHMAINKLLEI
ncbi:cofactor-independent phosphoglycerate mutase [Parasporobacterium paucivorans]|uniref:2,3-bisphosphoglycerate-independent phosphoglycerate mutase n=1 Tax=Parasporobacterium paucivorans DSM 15970 TaxID=1122934 RepID=A0A1M6KR09_9FIRM|nr:cofactor-independent phosphoglycerate mutase [Parasporobacterium paucivorans]SHJ61314.1 2,3-bisphosphoglycerate-independent phosphoglycerate mutase [Parasporobacterium paucivorans DSM 15970]